MKKKTPLGFDAEHSVMERGYAVVCGTDEAGRGPLMGPVYAAACILRDGVMIEGLDDSKKLSEKRREELFDIICESCVAYAVASSDVAMIESMNILEAAQDAMRRAVSALTVRPDAVIVDGNIARGFDIPAFTLVGGDAISPSIAAASILAKVSRDRVCRELDALYPEYNFAGSKGYGTAAHYAALDEYGIIEGVHRPSFLKKYIAARLSAGLPVKYYAARTAEKVASNESAEQVAPNESTAPNVSNCDAARTDHDGSVR